MSLFASEQAVNGNENAVHACRAVAFPAHSLDDAGFGANVPRFRQLDRDQTLVPLGGPFAHHPFACSNHRGSNRFCDEAPTSTTDPGATETIFRLFADEGSSPLLDRTHLVSDFPTTRRQTRFQIPPGICSGPRSRCDCRVPACPC